MTRQQLLQQQPKSEDQLQAFCVLYLNHNYSHLRGLCFSIPNGGSRHKAEAMKMKATGLVAGEPDFLIMLPAPHQPIAIEFKDIGGHLSPAQKIIHPIWAKANRPIHVVYNIQQFLAVIDTHIPNIYLSL